MRVAVLLILVVALASPAAAAPLRVRAERPDPGWIDFVASGTKGQQFSVFEGDEPVGTFTLGAARQRFRHAVRWRCDRLVRHFVATTADGASSPLREVRTRSCRQRLALSIRPVLPRAGRPVSVRVADRWRVGGVRGEVCLIPRRGGERCRRLRIRRGRPAATVRVGAPAPGMGAIEVRPAWGGALRRAVDLRRPGRALRLLATGDSMIQGVDAALAAELEGRGVAVRSDARIGTGISKPFMLDWVELARRQARRRHPDVTVVFLGANEGFAIKGATCCGRAWIEGYARRVERMVRAYARGGASRVYWLTLPTPSKPSFARVFAAVNRALGRAERTLRDHGRLVDPARVITPGGRFDRRHRQDDGIHLNAGGARLAARVIAAALRRDGITT